MSPNPIAVVTGASSGFGYQFARFAVEDGYDVIIVADEPEIEEAAEKLRRLGGGIEAHEIDLSSRQGMAQFWEAIEHRDIDLFFANAGLALGHAFHEQEWPDIRELIELNVRQTTVMLHKVGTKMQKRRSGRILVTGSIGGFVPGPYNAVYNGTKAYIDSLCAALHDEWKDGNVTLTNLMPGPADTEIFDRAGMENTPIVEQDNRGDHIEIARKGYDAMMAGEKGIVPGFTSKVLTMFSGIVPQSVTAEIHRWGARPRD